MGEWDRGIDYDDPEYRTACSGEDDGEKCPESLPNHAWGRIKAEGWFQQKDGTLWCPKHIPEWVPAWREAQAKKRAKK